MIRLHTSDSSILVFRRDRADDQHIVWEPPPHTPARSVASSTDLQSSLEGGVRRPCRNGSSCSDFSEGYIANFVRVFVESGIDIFFTQITNDYIDILPGEVLNRLSSTVWSIWRSFRKTIRVSYICQVFGNNKGVRPTTIILLYFWKFFTSPVILNRKANYANIITTTPISLR